MWRSSILVALLRRALSGGVVAILVASTALAETPNSLSTLTRVPCAVVLGRIVAIDPPAHAPRSETVEDESTGQRETLCIQAGDGNYVLRYERVTTAEQLTIDFIGAGELRIESRDKATHVRFNQPRKGRLQLTVVSGNVTQRIEAASLWHMLLAQPQLCQTHLVPLLEEMQPDWKLAQQSAAIERLLLASDAPRDARSLQQVQALVEDLARPSFSVRQAAYRELIDHGPTIVSQLARIKPSSLDAEQRARLAEVRRHFSYSSPDSAERVVTWLSDDKEAWQALAARPEQDVRTIAGQRLEALP